MDSFIEKEKRAQVLVEALPYIQEYWNRVVVVKYGGHAMTDETLKRQVMEDIVLLQLVGVKVVLVHGGGRRSTPRWAKWACRASSSTACA